VLKEESTKSLPALLASLGMCTISSAVSFPENYLPVILDGQIIGYVASSMAEPLATRLRYMKAMGQAQVPSHLEIALIDGKATPQFPSLSLFTNMCRMIRPTMYLPANKIEHIGSMEQIYLSVACMPEDINPALHTHMEIKPTNMLSMVARLTPFSDFNQSPRNMYQCQVSCNSCTRTSVPWRERERE
jgi:DNA-directed RNA polymerase I subunit RPA2